MNYMEEKNKLECLAIASRLISEEIERRPDTKTIEALLVIGEMIVKQGKALDMELDKLLEQSGV